MSYITLYDTPMNVSCPWAPNVWRIRLILNFKRVAYRTKWIQLPDVERELRAIGAPPTSQGPDGRHIYTLPVIIDPRSHLRPVILSNPAKIAEYLETNYPARPLFPEGSKALQTLFVHYLQEDFIRPLLPIMVPLSHQRLPENIQNHFFPPGRRPHEPYPPGPQREQAWRAVQDNFDFLSSILSKNSGDDGDGVVVSGRDLTYSDFAICAILIWIEKVSPHEGWPRVRTWNHGRWNRLWERCRGHMDVF